MKCPMCGYNIVHERVIDRKQMVYLGIFMPILATSIFGMIILGVGTYWSLQGVMAALIAASAISAIALWVTGRRAAGGPEKKKDG